MAGYQRFVAYVYEYRKGKKSQNCGFIKVEVRDNRCRMEVNLQCPGLTPQVPCKIYGFVRNSGLLDGVLLSTCQTKDGAVQNVVELDARDMNHSGVALGKFGGMILKTESGAFFGTEWDDQVIRPENFRERVLKKEENISDRTQNGTRREELENGKKVMQEVNTRLDTERKSGLEPELRSELKSEKELESEMELDPEKELKPEMDLGPETKPGKELKSEMESKPEMAEGQLVIETEKISKQKDSDEKKGNVQAETQSVPEINVQSLQAAEMREPESTEQAPDERNAVSWRDDSEYSSTTQRSMQPEYQPGEQPSPMQQRPMQPNSPAGQRPTTPPRPTHQRPPQPRCITRFPQMGEPFDPFGDGEIRNPRRIQLKDVANFPCRDCALKQNRFLQHGHTQFGHLMIGQMPSGCYIIGVPGMYNQQEQFMANMFGFPYFKESQAIRVPGGKGGYWYRSINAADFD